MVATCDLCGSEVNKFIYSMPDLRFRYYKQEYTVVECLWCGHRFLSPRPTIESMSIIYPENYYAGRGPTDQRPRERYLRQMHYLPDIKDGKILDVGCAGGGWLKVIQDKGWDCYGFDLVETQYKEDGIDIKYGYLPESDYPDYFFDVVSAWGVMEHIHEPSKYFRSINRLLKNKGMFIFLVPNGNSLWSRWAYKEDIPRHLHFFRLKTLKSYAQKYGFNIKMIEYTNKIYSRPATGRGLFRSNLLKLARASWAEIVNPPQRFALRLLGKFGSLLDYCLIHPKLEEYLGLCGNMIVIFEKETSIGTE